MKMGAFMMGCGLLVCGLDLMPFWFMGTCVAAGLALIAQERTGWKDCRSNRQQQGIYKEQTHSRVRTA